MDVAVVAEVIGDGHDRVGAAGGGGVTATGGGVGSVGVSDLHAPSASTIVTAISVSPCFICGKTPSGASQVA